MTQPPETAPLQATGSASVVPTRTRRLPAPIIPIRPIGPEHRAQLLRHFLALGPDDRYLRFGYAASDERIRAYVDSIRFGVDDIFGVFNRKLELLAVAHIAIEEGHAQRAEFGVSVLPRGRGLGIGTRLFARAAMDARNRGLRVLYMQCLSSNAAMLKIARRAGMKVRNEGGETEAYLELPEDDYQSHLHALMEDQTGQIDYWVKAAMRQLRCFWLFGRCPDTQ
ncbi:MAG: GNAT family N-acetyltransferase [Thiomonas sp.]|uniref:GNAT family N-acetyltransferase n=1 Tax=Thiomonas sp. TaxID=2047785 RepID=UPI002A3715C6|nr:GNAT family N-acetyltransferase [Thiomonas sp.]MDY0330693.1 GNAT family N-acetyltransferase [Thiomonas sp.]